MRKKILSASFVVAMAAIAGYNTYVNQTKVEMSDLALANLEALANSEGEETVTCGTGEKHYPSLSKCGICNCEFGIKGIFYYRTEGRESSYKYGLEGSQHYCCCNGHDAVYSSAKTRKCSE